jgi:hypothetical protein
MMFLPHLTPGLLTLALAALLAACGSETGSPSAVGAAPQGQLVANDCRSPNAQATQRGCRPLTRTIATQ